MQAFLTRAVFGTAAYMSPEQARGEFIDRRTDVWAFGCVLYEMLVGRPAFQGDGIEEILTAVRNQEPDWSLLPPALPAGVARLLRKCLEKDANRRLHDIADARTEIEDANGPMARSIPPRTAWLMLAGAAALAVTAGVWNVTRPTNPGPDGSRIRRLELRLPEGGPLARTWSMPLGVGQPSIAISPDGARLVYVLERQGVTQLYLRVIDQMQVTPIPSTEGAFGPFFSPDGSWIGFFAGNKLKKVATAGGEPIELCDAPNPYGGSWGSDGIILFAPDEGRRPALVPEAGGTSQQIVVRNSGGSFRQPDLLPGGKAAIVSNALRRNVGVLSLETGEYRPLVERAGGGRYAPSGHLVFARSGALLALSFDPEKLTVTGPEHVILEGVRMDAVGPVVTQAAFSREGTLVYAPGSGVAAGAVRPVWVDRQGTTQPLAMPPRSYGNFSLSPDGRKLAIVVIEEPDRDLWVQDLERGTITPLTSRGCNRCEPLVGQHTHRVQLADESCGAGFHGAQRRQPRARAADHAPVRGHVLVVGPRTGWQDFGRTLSQVRICGCFR